MDGAEEQAVVGLEGSLGAVAVVDVEIDHGDAGHALGLGHAGGDGDVGKQAEAHALARLGMVAGWADGGEGPGRLATGHGADGVDHGPGGEAGGADAARRQDGVGIKLAEAAIRRGGEQAPAVVYATALRVMLVANLAFLLGAWLLRQPAADLLRHPLHPEYIWWCAAIRADERNSVVSLTSGRASFWYSAEMVCSASCAATSPSGWPPMPSASTNRPDSRV